MQPPNWLPYSLKKMWNGARVKAALGHLNQSAPVMTAPPEDAQLDVCMLLCRRDLQLGVLAAKSLLRFFEAPVGITFTDDGSLSGVNRAWVASHLPGCRWLPRIVDDPRMTAGLAARPRLASVYKSKYHPICKLLHPVLLSSCRRVLVVDPDTAFYRCPDVLLTWVAGDDESAWFLHDQQNESTNVPNETREVFEKLRGQFAESDRPWSMPYYFFNSGLLAFRPEQCDLDVAEEYLCWRETAPSQYKTGTPGLWFGDWTPEQTSYQLIFATMSPPARPLGNKYRLGHIPDQIFNHFLWLNVCKPQTLETLAALTLEIQQQSSSLTPQA